MKPDFKAKTLETITFKAQRFWNPHFQHEIVVQCDKIFETTTFNTILWKNHFFPYQMKSGKEFFFVIFIIVTKHTFGKKIG